MSTTTVTPPSTTADLQAFEEKSFQNNMAVQEIGMIAQGHAQTISVLNNMSSAESSAASQSGRL